MRLVWKILISYFSEFKSSFCVRVTHSCVSNCDDTINDTNYKDTNEDSPQYGGAPCKGKTQHTNACRLKDCSDKGRMSYNKYLNNDL